MHHTDSELEEVRGGGILPSWRNVDHNLALVSIRSPKPAHIVSINIHTYVPMYIL